MRNSTLGKFLLSISFIVSFLLSCKDDSSLTIAPPSPDVSFTEEFDTATAAYNRGWRYLNVSDPKNVGFWAQGGFNDPAITGFPGPVPYRPYSSKGSYAGFIGTDYTSTTTGTISNWVVSPVTLMKNGDKIIFYTRGIAIFYGYGTDSTDFSNRMQVCYSTNGGSLDVGSGTNPGAFSNVILDINPFYKEYHTVSDPITTDAYTWTVIRDPQAYPVNWTRFEAKVSGLNGAVSGRFAFRYFVENAGLGPLGTRATGVGLDSVAFVSAK
jgi:hypothetical protein